jgi:DNA polymerase III gamma/tau subunit
MIFDECHQITSDAQDAALKLTEDVPAHCYLIFCSSEPDKLKTAFRSRLSSYVLQSITADDLEQLARTTAAKFGAAFSDEVIEACVNSSKGSARRLLVSLQQLTTLSNDNDRLAFLELTDSREASESLAKLLVSGASWAKVAAALRASEDEPEKLRRGILAYSSAILLNQPTDNAFRRRMVTIMEAMQFDLYSSGKPGLVLACFNLCQS